MLNSNISSAANFELSLSLVGKVEIFEDQSLNLLKIEDKRPGASNSLPDGC